MSAALWRLAAALLAAFFVYATAVQYNDPDWYTWVALYGGCALASGLAAAGRPRRWLALLLLLVALPWCLWLAPQVNRTLAPVKTEVGRETLGLSISALAMLFLVLAAPRRAPARS